MHISPVPAELPQGVYVYLHLLGDSDPSDDKSVFYVGLGRGRRAWVTSRNNQFWQNTCSKHGRLVWIVEDGLTQDQAASLEVSLIAQYWVSGAKLTNMTTGGDGAPNLSDDARARKSLGISKAKKGKPLSEAARRAIGAAHKGRIFAPEHRAKISEAAKRQRSAKQIECARIAGKTKAKAVVCVETGEVFETARAAAQWIATESHPKATHAPIRWCCTGRAKTAYGHTWRYQK